MNQEGIMDCNKLIAEFMGFRVFHKRYPKNHGIGAPELELKDCILEKTKYHKSWDELMTVVDKIRDNDCIVIIRFNRQMKTTNAFIACFESKWVNDININGIGIEPIYNAVIQFIKWYNQKK